MKSVETIVVGAGVIGMMSAWQLAKAGQQVLLIDANDLGQQASRCAAGMIGAQLEVAEPGPFFTLCKESRAMFPDLAEELRSLTGIDIELDRHGILWLSTSEKEKTALLERQAWQDVQGASSTWLPQDEVCQREPFLRHQQGALHMHEDTQVRATAMVAALSQVVRQTCQVVLGEAVTSLSPQTGGVMVTTQRAVYHAARVVIANGAYAKPLLQAVGITYDVFPVKGQACLLAPVSPRTLKHTVYHDHGYLVPKRDGTILVGATANLDAGFQTTITVNETATLLSKAQQLLPALADAVVLDVWAGLRPGNAVGHPLIGATDATSRVIVATGHYRNGLLLAPITASIVTTIATEQPLPARWSFLSPTLRAVTS